MYVVFHSNFAACTVCRRHKPCEFLSYVWTDCWGNKSYYIITSPANSQEQRFGRHVQSLGRMWPLGAQIVLYTILAFISKSNTLVAFSGEIPGKAIDGATKPNESNIGNAMNKCAEVRWSLVSQDSFNFKPRRRISRTNNSTKTKLWWAARFSEGEAVEKVRKE